MMCGLLYYGKGKRLREKIFSSSINQKILEYSLCGRQGGGERGSDKLFDIIETVI